MNDLAETRLARQCGGLNRKPADKARAGQIGGKNFAPEGLLGKIRAGHIANAKLTRADCVWVGGSLFMWVTMLIVASSVPPHV
jgi:hypothetical protein